MRSLLDVNVLIAMIDPDHVHHDLAQGWFHKIELRPWATCPIVENGVLRIVGNPRYPGSPGTPFATLATLRELRSVPDHNFLPDDIDFVEAGATDVSLGHPLQVTDTYLALLARAHGAKLATLDRRLERSLPDDLKAYVELVE